MTSEAPGAVPIRARTPGAVTASVQIINDRAAVVVNIDDDATRGALTSTCGDTIRLAAELALDKRIPLVTYVASSGADLTEGVSAVHGWGTAARALVACSGVVPIIFCVTGPAVSGPALLLGIADIAVMLDESYAFVSGPHMVELFTGVPIATETLGGSAVHGSRSGAASFTVPDLAAAEELIADLLLLLPPNTDTEPRLIATGDDPYRLVPELSAVMPDSPTGSYDVRDILRAVADDELLLESRAGWAANLVTAFATVAGRPVGMIANQPQVLAGTIDIAASQKGARFVAFCDAFNLPLVTFVDTPGFQPGKDLEWRGMIRHGAQLAFSYARATVFRICVTLRKSYGGAYIVMDSKYMGNDIALAWPSSEIAVMGAKGAVEILNRGIDDDERRRLEAEYEERLLNPYRAAERGSIDAVIDPADTRREIASALVNMSSKRERLPGRAHDNSPL
jgi:acetyl-CoA carboxylase carboxyltransferase component